MRLQTLSSKYKAPTADDYLQLKWLELKKAEREKVEARKNNLERLKSAVKRQRAKSARLHGNRVSSSGGSVSRRMRGKTFNIEFQTVQQLTQDMKL
jgi:hypothetical protein